MNAPSELADDVRAAAAGDQRAWDRLVHRMTPTLRAVARQYRLSASDRDEVTQQTWFALVTHIHRIHDPAAVAGWLVTTARRESLRVLRAGGREVPVAEVRAQETTPESTTEDVRSEHERRDAVRQALGRIPQRQRALMEALMKEPALSYEEVSAKLDMPVGSIGPTRARCMTRLRRDPQVANLFAGDVRHHPTRPDRQLPDVT